MKRYLPVLAVCALGVLSGCAALLPGPQHALWPGLAGLERISPDGAAPVWADDPDAVRYLPLIAQASADLTPFFGAPPQPGRIILCTAQPCAARLGTYAAGLTYGTRLVLIAPRGLNASVITHELAHSATNRGLPVSALWDPPFPAWFHEGLAVWLAPPDPRYRRPDTVAEAAWITQAQTLRDWKALLTEDTYPQVYGAAGRMVEALADEIGPQALRAVVRDVQGGAAFDTRLAEAREEAREAARQEAKQSR